MRIKMESVKDCVLRNLNSSEAFNLLPVFIYLGIILLFGCLGNGLSLYVYSTNFKQSNSRCFFIFLSAMELLSCICIVPMEIYMMAHHFDIEYGNGKCKSLMFSNIWQVHVSSVILILVAVDRWRKICHPFKWQISLKLSKLLLICLILLSFIIALPSLVVYSPNPRNMFNITLGPDCIVNGSKVLPDITVYKCSTNNDSPENIYLKLYVLFFWIMVLTGVAALSLFYWNITKKVRLQENKFKTGGVNACQSYNLVQQESIDRENIEIGALTKPRKGNNDMENKYAVKSDQGDGFEVVEDETCSTGSRKYEYENTDVETNTFKIKKRTDTLCSDGLNSLNDETEMNDSYIENDDNVLETTDGNKTHVTSEIELKNDLIVSLPNETRCGREKTHVENHVALSVNSKTNRNKENMVPPSQQLTAQRRRRLRLMQFKSESSEKELTGTTKSILQSKSRSRNVTLIMFVITVSTLFSFLPYLVLSTERAFIRHFEINMTSSQYAVYNVFLRSYFLKSLTNPLVYGVLDPRFRASVRQIFQRRK